MGSASPGRSQTDHGFKTGTFSPCLPCMHYRTYSRNCSSGIFWVSSFVVNRSGKLHVCLSRNVRIEFTVAIKAWSQWSKVDYYVDSGSKFSTGTNIHICIVLSTDTIGTQMNSFILLSSGFWLFCCSLACSNALGKSHMTLEEIILRIAVAIARKGFAVIALNVSTTP